MLHTKQPRFQTSEVVSFVGRHYRDPYQGDSTEPIYDRIFEFQRLLRLFELAEYGKGSLSAACLLRVPCAGAGVIAHLL